MAPPIPTRTNPLRHRTRVWIAGLLLTVIVAACESATDVQGGFLVIRTLAGGEVGFQEGDQLQIVVKEVSGEQFPDSIFFMAPVDTVVLDVPLATYLTSISNLPLACEVRGGAIQQAFVPEPGLSAQVLFRVNCSSFLIVRIGTGGQMLDDAYVVRMVSPTGATTTELVNAQDTIRPADVVPGEYQLTLFNVEDNCTVVTDGGRTRRATVTPPRSSTLEFGVVCSAPEHRPELLEVRGGMGPDGLSTLILRVADPGSPGEESLPDLDGYHWDVTDCDRNSLLDPGEVARRGLFGLGQPTRGVDSLTIGVIMEVRLREDAPPGARCIEARVVDSNSNTSPVVEVPFSTTGSPPIINRFDVVTAGTSFDPVLQFTFEATDPDGDLLGTYIRIVRSNGDVLGRGITGHSGSTIPDLRLAAVGLTLEDVREIRVFAIDRGGNFTRAADADLSR